MPASQQLKQLINLARVDGKVVESEKRFIIAIGQANHMLLAEILPLFTSEHSESVAVHQTDEQKFDLIFNLVQLMKIDEKLYRDEIRYCAKIASRLGYREEALFELMLKVRATAMEKGEIDALKKLTSSYLKR